MKKFFKDFKTFISRGNVLDLAVAILVGGSFTSIVNSLVKDIIMPLISLLIGGIAIEDWKWVITPANENLGIAENAVRYGSFIQVIINFFIISFFVFVVFRVLNLSRQKLEKIKEDILKKEGNEKKEVKSELTFEQKQEILLTEIRDILKDKEKKQ